MSLVALIVSSIIVISGAGCLISQYELIKQQRIQTDSEKQSSQAITELGADAEITQRQNKNSKNMTPFNILRIVCIGILIATVLTCIMHKVYLFLKQKEPTVSVFSESATVSIYLSVFTAVTAIMIYKKQTESTELAAQEVKTRDKIYKNTLQQFYGACLTMEINTKIGVALQQTVNTWQTDSIQQLRLEKNEDNSVYNLHLMLSDALRSQNVLNIDSATCTVQSISGTKLFKITVNCKNVVENTVDSIGYNLVIPLNNTSVTTPEITQKTVKNAQMYVPKVLYETLCRSVHKHESVEMQICFKHLQHRYLRIPQVKAAGDVEDVEDGANKKLTALVANIENVMLHYDTDIRITLDDGALGTNAVQFNVCKTWRAYTALSEDGSDA